MSNKAILNKAIQKAIDGGWDVKSSDWNADNCPFGLIYNHDFAKALWGDSLLHDVVARDYSRSDKVYWTLDPMYMPPNNWQFHLQQMVISDDPLQYLADNLGK